MNVLFFIGTVYYLVDHWRKAAGVINSQVVEIPIWNKYSFQPFAYCPKQSLRAQVRSNFLIVLKLFFIMGTFQALINRNNERLLARKDLTKVLLDYLLRLSDDYPMTIQ